MTRASFVSWGLLVFTCKQAWRYSLIAPKTIVWEQMELPRQFDNITSHVIDDLKVTLRQGSKVSMAAASFSIYAFEALQK